MIQSPSLLLAMDTSGDICSVAVFRDGRFRAEYAFLHEMHLSERLMGDVDSVLHAADATLEEVDTFAVGIGPGSFTGTRIGVMTMKTFAFVGNRPLIGIGSLDAMAAEYSGLSGVVVTPIMACRTGMVYACPFRVDENVPVPLIEAAAFPFADLGAALQAFDVERFLFCGPAAARYETELGSALGIRSARAAFVGPSYPRASLIARLAGQRLTSDVPHPEVMNLVPLYISPPPISTPRQPIPTGVD